MSEGLPAPSARLARFDDLPQLLELFAAAPVSDAAQPLEHAEAIWRETLAHSGTHVFVAHAGSAIAATCMLVTAPNLLRAGRSHAFLENVATHPAYQGRGYGTAVVRAALDFAWSHGCHQILMQSGRADPRVHAFYRQLGFEPGLRTAYVAIRPGGAS